MLPAKYPKVLPDKRPFSAYEGLRFEVEVRKKEAMNQDKLQENYSIQECLSIFSGFKFVYKLFCIPEFSNKFCFTLGPAPKTPLEDPCFQMP